MVASAEVAPSSIPISRWPGERLLRALIILVALGIWLLLAVSVIGIVYAVLLGVFFFFAHLAFITHLRGNAVRLGPEQMPDLHRRVEDIARRIGIERPPAAYVVQAGGSLNALATRFLGSSFIVLYSDLLDACGDNEDARDFVIAHELGHLAAGHLRWRWLLIPALVIPFLGHAYSRACEYTSDRYGLRGGGGRSGALDGLCILAAGGELGPRVNRRALAEQRRELNTAWMTIGRWLSTHPPIAHRLAELDPGLVNGSLRRMRPRLGAVAVLALLIIVPAGLLASFAATVWPQIRESMSSAQAAAADPAVDLTTQIEHDILALVEVAEGHRASAGTAPASLDELYAAWSAAHPDVAAPLDPYDGQRYGYQLDGEHYVIWSIGPDAEDHADNLYYSSASQEAQ